MIHRAGLDILYWNTKHTKYNNRYIVHEYINKKNIIWISFNSLSFYSVGKERIRKRSIDILSKCEYHFIRVHENLVQYPSNNISNKIM